MKILDRCFSILLVFCMAFHPSHVFASTDANGNSNEKKQSSYSFADAFREGKRNDLDPFQLLRQSTLFETGKLSSNKRNLFIANLTESYSRFDEGLLRENRKISSSDYGFEIYDKGGFHHYFHIPVSSIVTFGKRVLWVEKTVESAPFLFWIDAKYPGFGKVEIPIFRIPLEQHHEVRLEGKKLFLGNKEVSIKALDQTASTQMASFHLLLNLTRPDQLPYAAETIDALLKDFYQGMKSAETSEALFFDREKEQIAEAYRQLAGAQVEMLPGWSEAIATGERKGQVSDKVLDNIRSQNRLLRHFNESLALFTVPRPDQIRGFRDNLLLLYIGYQQNESALKKEAFRSLFHSEGIRQSLLYASIGISLFANSEAFFHYLNKSVGLVSHLLSQTYGSLGGLLILAKESFVMTVSGFHPMVFGEAYLFNGLAVKTAVGLSFLLFAAMSSVFIPHVIVNAYKLFREDFSFFKNSKSLKMAFIERQRQVEKQYIDLLIAERRGVDLSGAEAVSETELKEIRAYIKAAKEKDFPEGRWMRFFRKIRKLSHTSAEVEEKIFEKNIDSFGSALAHFLFSMASFTKSATFFIHFWNLGFVARALVFKPRMMPYFFIYPKFFYTAVTARVEEIHMPKKENGGKWTHLDLLKHYLFNSREERKEANQNNRLRLSIEWQLEKEILKRGNVSLLRTAKEGRALRKALRFPVESMTDKNIKKQSFLGKMYLYWFHEEAMREGMKDIIELGLQSELSTTDLIEKYLKSEKGKTTLRNAEFIASQKAKRGRRSIENYIKNYELKALYSVDPRNSPAMERFAEALKYVTDPAAVSRAVRSTISNVLVDRPMKLLFLVFMIAGAEGDMLRPVHEELFGSNSFVYLSRYQFYSIYLHGLVAGTLYQTWMKLQYDARLASTGLFKKIPTGEEAKLSFFQYYRKNYNHSENTWWKNQWHISRLALINLGVATLSYASFKYLYLGRFDLDLYFAGYLLFFMSPFSGISGKLENTFESSLGHVLRDIPEKYHSHKEVVKYNEFAKNVYRFRYSFFMAIYSNTVENFMSTMKSMESSVFGSRGFSRWLLSGHTFSSLMAKGLDQAEEVAPIMKKPVEFCRKVFFTNLTEGKN